MSGNDEKPLEWHYSADKRLPMFLFVLVCTVLGLIALSPVVTGGGTPSISQWIIIVLTVLCAFATIIYFVRLFSVGLAARVTSKGLTAPHIANAEIPWSAIRAVNIRKIGRYDFIFLDVDEKVAQSLPLTRTARFSANTNRELGDLPYCFSLNESSGSTGGLVALIKSKITLDEVT